MPVTITVPKRHLFGLDLLVGFPFVFQSLDLLGECVHLVFEAVVALLELFKVVGHRPGLTDKNRLATFGETHRLGLGI